MMATKANAQVGDKQITIETGKLAKLADGAVTVQLGETIVLVAAVAAGLRGGTIPFTGETAQPLELNRTTDPFTAAGAVWHALAAQPVLLFEALVLAAAAAVLPHVRRRCIAAFALALLAGLVAPDPTIPNAALMATILATCLGMAVKRES